MSNPYTYLLIHDIVKLEVHVVSMMSIQVHSSPFKSIQVHSSPFRSIQVHSDSFILLHGHGADTIINSCHHHHRKLFRGLEMSYSQVWYTVGIISSSPTQFHTEIIGLIRVQLSVIGLIDIFKNFKAIQMRSKTSYSQVWYTIGSLRSSLTHSKTELKGLVKVSCQ